MEAVYSEKHKNYTINIYQDENGESPREWDNLGEMACFHGRYDLGDKHEHTIESLDAIIKRKDIVALPLFLYDHSGITINTSPFSCRWDSGQVGYIFISHEKIRSEYSIKRVTKKWKEKIKSYLINEVKTYDNYLTGNVYGYEILDNKKNDIDSCWGFFGDYDKVVLNEARSFLDRWIECDN